MGKKRVNKPGENRRQRSNEGTKEICDPKRKMARGILAGLFLAAAMTVSGCDNEEHVHVDRDGDGYCDEDGESMRDSHGRYYGHGPGYYGRYGSSGSGSTAAGDGAGGTANVSQGTSVGKGGIGGHSGGGGG